MNDIFSPYERGLDALLSRLGSDHPRYAETLTLQSRLRENVGQARRYGDSETLRAGRAQILDALNGLALETLQVSFNELYERVEGMDSRPLDPTAGRNTDGEAVGHDLPSCPFISGPMITDRRLFVGRREILAQIVGRMEGVQPISVNIVGERRIGKSSLLYHLFQTWSERVREPGRYVVAYLNLQSARAQKRTTFYRAVAEALLQRPAVQRYTDVTAPLSQVPLTKAAFEEGVRALRAHGPLPVLCLDEFEALFAHPDEFDNSFYDALRSLTNGGSLMLVVASRRPLQTYRREQRLTSRFFNDGHVLTLGELTEAEAADLVRLPASTVRGAAAALSLEEQRLARRWGGRHPCRLQLAADALCRARQRGKDVTWARHEFENQEQAQFGTSGGINWHALCALFLGIPRRLGQLARRTGETVDDVTNWLLGMLIVIVVLLVLLGILRGGDLLSLLRGLLGG